MLRVVSVCAALAAVSCGSASAPAPSVPAPSPGTPAPSARVPFEPKPELRFSSTLQARAYRAHLAIDPTKPELTGELELDATLTAPASRVWLGADKLTITAAEARTADGTVVLAPSLDGEYLGLTAARDLPAGEVTIHLAYTARIKSDDTSGAFVQSVDGSSYVISDFEAQDARDVFPCLDDPSSKVPWTITIDAPAGNIALSNAPEAKRTTLDDGGTRFEFEPTKPLPSYLVAFAVGPFEMVDAGKSPSGTRIRIAALKGRSDRATYAAKVTKDIVGLLEEYFDMPFPFPKLDLVPIPTSSFAMENAGMITFWAEGLLPSPGAGAAEHLSYESVAAHEIAHQWFGDYVTLAWWDDIWLNEAFASWAEEKVMRRRPGWSEGDEVGDRQSGLGSDSMASARRIRQPIVKQDDIEDAFDGITYSKGAAVIRMFEQWVGEETFRDGVRQYVRDHAYGTANASQFLAAIDAASPKEVAGAFATFLDQAGAPRVRVAMACHADGPATVTLQQDRWLPRGAPAPEGDAPRWQIPVCVAAGDKKTRATTCTLLTEAQAEVPLEGARCPTWIAPVAGGTGYYRGWLDGDAAKHLLTDGWAQLSTGERLTALNDLRMMADDGALDVSILLDTIPRFLDAGPKVSAHAISLGWQVWGLTEGGPLEPAAQRWIRATFGKRARKLGWLPPAKATADEQRAQMNLVTLVAHGGRDPELLAKARKLAATWRDLPPAVRSTILSHAVLSSPELAKKLLVELDATTDRELHSDLLSALTSTEDPELVLALLNRLLDPNVDIVQEYWLAYGGVGGRKNQQAVAAFMREHVDEIAPRLPEKSRDSIAWSQLGGDCLTTDRAALAAWLDAKVKPLRGGERATQRVLESLDQCVTYRTEMTPPVTAWLKKQKK
jgi:alanyl aminopeptidase